MLLMALMRDPSARLSVRSYYVDGHVPEPH